MSFRTLLTNSISKKALLVAFIHWYVTFFLEKNFFVTSTLEKPFVVIAKLIVIVCFWQIVFYMVRRYKTEHEYRSYIHFVGVYFIFSMVLLLLIWPGNWLLDDYILLQLTHELEFMAWQHFLSQMFYYCAIFIFPTPVNIEILHIVCISLIVGYFVYTIYLLTNKSKIAFLSYIPFILPNVLLQNYFLLRAGLFTYLIIFLVVYYIHQASKKENLTYSKLLILAVVTATIATLRSEGILFIFASPIIFLILFRKTTPRAMILCFLATTACIYLCLGQFQTYLINYKNKYKDTDKLYLLTAIITPLYHLTKKAASDQREDLLLDVKAVLDIQQFYTDVPSWNVISSTPIIKENYFNSKARRKLLRAYVKLIQTYPNVFFDNRISQFMSESNTQTYTSNKLNTQYYSLFQNTVSDYISTKRRAKTLTKLSLKNKFLNNHLPPIALLLILSTICLFRKKFVIPIITSALMGMVGIVFITSPGPYFMYYFSVYLTGYALAFGALSIALSKLFKPRHFYSPTSPPEQAAL